MTKTPDTPDHKPNKEITISISDNVISEDDGSIFVDGKIISGFRADDPRAASVMEEVAKKYLAAVAYIRKQEEEDLEQRILTMMYHVFNAYYGHPFNGKKYTDHIHGKDTTLSADPKWRRVAETVVRLEELQK